MIEIAFGIIAGIVCALGMGGGTVLILLLSLLKEIDQHVLQATNLVFFIPTSITAIIINYKNKIIKWKDAKNVVIFGIIGAIVGCWISNSINSNNLKKIFGIFIGILAIFQFYEIYTSYNKKKNVDNKTSRLD